MKQNELLRLSVCDELFASTHSDLIEPSFFLPSCFTLPQTNVTMCNHFLLLLSTWPIRSLWTGPLRLQKVTTEILSSCRENFTQLRKHCLVSQTHHGYHILFNWVFFLVSSDVGVSIPPIRRKWLKCHCKWVRCICVDLVCFLFLFTW